MPLKKGGVHSFKYQCHGQHCHGQHLQTYRVKQQQQLFTTMDRNMDRY